MSEEKKEDLAQPAAEAPKVQAPGEGAPKGDAAPANTPSSARNAKSCQGAVTKAIEAIVHIVPTVQAVSNP